MKSLTIIPKLIVLKKKFWLLPTILISRDAKFFTFVGKYSKLLRINICFLNLSVELSFYYST
jgi:hypothetical protein